MLFGGACWSDLFPWRFNWLRPRSCDVGLRASKTWHAEPPDAEEVAQWIARAAQHVQSRASNAAPPDGADASLADAAAQGPRIRMSAYDWIAALDHSLAATAPLAKGFSSGARGRLTLKTTVCTRVARHQRTQC
jgi:hypothetical protein